MSLRPDPAAFVKPADLWARAIIAAARAYGDDPVEALTSPGRGPGRGGKRRSLPAACLGISEATGLPILRAAPVLGLQPNQVRAQKTNCNREFKAAWKAAARAVEYACWRPEAAESVAQAAGQLDLTGTARAEVIAAEDAPGWEAELAQAVEALPQPAPVLRPAPEARPVRPARPHAPLAGRVNLANGHAFAPAYRFREAGPPPPTQSLEGRILAQLAERPGSPRGLASVLDVKESFVAQTLRNLGREGRVTAADLAPGASDRDQAWRLA